MDRAVISHLASWIIYTIIWIGIYNRFDKILHRKIMITAFILDVLLVLYIEIGREAVKQAFEFPDGWLGVHIIFSLLTIVLYLLMIAVGQKLFKGNESIRGLHIKLAYTFLFVKSMNLVTSYLF